MHRDRRQDPPETADAFRDPFFGHGREVEAQSVLVAATGEEALARDEGHVLFEGAFRTNLDDPNSYALSDHLPVLAVFSTSK